MVGHIKVNVGAGRLMYSVCEDIFCYFIVLAPFTSVNGGALERPLIGTILGG